MKPVAHSRFQRLGHFAAALPPASRSSVRGRLSLAPKRSADVFSASPPSPDELTVYDLKRAREIMREHVAFIERFFPDNFHERYAHKHIQRGLRLFKRTRVRIDVGDPICLGLDSLPTDATTFDFAPHITRPMRPRILDDAEHLTKVEFLDFDNYTTQDCNLGMLEDRLIRALNPPWGLYPQRARTVGKYLVAEAQSTNPFAHFHILGAESMGGWHRGQIDLLARVLRDRVLFDPDFNAIRPVFDLQVLEELGASAQKNHLIANISGSGHSILKRVFEGLPDFATNVLNDAVLGEHLRSENIVPIGSSPKFELIAEGEEHPADRALHEAWAPYTILLGKWVIGRRLLKAWKLDKKAVVKTASDSVEDLPLLLLGGENVERILGPICPEQMDAARFLETEHGIQLRYYEGDALFKAQNEYLAEQHRVAQLQKVFIGQVANELKAEGFVDDLEQLGRELEQQHSEAMGRKPKKRRKKPKK